MIEGVGWYTCFCERETQKENAKKKGIGGILQNKSKNILAF